MGQQDAQLLADHRVGQCADRGARTHRRRPEVDPGRDHVPPGQHARLELGEDGGGEPGRASQVLHDRCQRLDPGCLHLDLDAQEPHRVLVVNRDRGLVQGHLGDVLVTDPQHEGSAPGLHLEHLVQWPPADERRYPPPDGPGPVEPVVGGAVERFVHLPPTLRRAVGAARQSGQRLQGHFLLGLRVPDAQDVAGLGDPPVVGVEVEVVLDHGRLRRRDQRPQGCERLRARQGGQPPAHRPQVEGIELPLDLDRVGLPTPWTDGHGTGGYCRPAGPSARADLRAV